MGKYGEIEVRGKLGRIPGSNVALPRKMVVKIWSEQDALKSQIFAH